MNSSDDLPDEWKEFAAEQQRADSRRLTHRAFGIDDKLNEMLDAKASGKVQPAKQLRNLELNRASKHRRRQRHLLELYATEAKFYSENCVLGQMIVDEDVRWLRERTSDDEWNILLMLRGEERTFLEVASKFGKNLNTLKSMVARCEARLHAAVAA